jgi:hypothetical protein
LVRTGDDIPTAVKFAGRAGERRKWTLYAKTYVSFSEYHKGLHNAEIFRKNKNAADTRPQSTVFRLVYLEMRHQ